MKSNIWILLTLLSLSGCAAKLSEQNPSAYEDSLKQAKIILKSNKGVKKYEKYYNSPNHKAIAQSKVNGVGGYSSNKTSKEYAIESALERCNMILLKRYDEITERVSCEIVNIDNEWLSK